MGNSGGGTKEVDLKDGTLVRRIVFKKPGDSWDRPALSLDNTDKVGDKKHYVLVYRPEGNDKGTGKPYITQREFTQNALAKIKANLELGVDYDVIFELGFEGSSSCIWTCSSKYMY